MGSPVDLCYFYLVRLFEVTIPASNPQKDIRVSLNRRRIFFAMIRDACVAGLWIAKTAGLRKLRRRNDLCLSEGYSARAFGQLNHDVFFGYYDVTPFNVTDSRMLACRRSRPAKISIQKKFVLEVGYFDLENRNTNFRRIDETTTWSWQMAARLQWLPKSDRELVIFNKDHDGDAGAVIKDVATNSVEAQFSKPIFAVDHSGRKALSLNFARLEQMRPGYGFMSDNQQVDEHNAPANDGVWLLDLHSGEVDLVFSLKQAAELRPQKSMVGARHYFNHLIWSPDGTRAMLFHIWESFGKRNIRVITLDTNNWTAFLLTNESHVSHYCYLDKERLLLYCTYQGKQGYHVFRDPFGYEDTFPVCDQLGDGHPSQHPKSDLVLTDTMINSFGERELYLIDSDGVRRLIGSFATHLWTPRAQRCDLHPRWSSTGNLISLDTTHSGKREMLVITSDKKKWG